MFRLCIFDRKFECRMDRRWRMFRDGSLDVLPTEPLPDSSAAQALDRHGEDAPREKCPFLDTPLIPQLASEDSIDGTMTGSSGGRQRIDLAKRGTSLSLEDSRRLIVGITHSLRNTLRKLKGPSAPPSAVSGYVEDDNYTTFAYRTSTYQLHYFEVASGWRFVLLATNPIVIVASPRTAMLSSAKGSGARSDVVSATRMLMAGLSLSSGGADSLSPANDPPLVNARLEALYGLFVEHVIRHAVYRTASPQEAFVRHGWLRHVDSYVQGLARAHFIPQASQ